MAEEKPKLVITTVGTSLLDKLRKKYVKQQGKWILGKLGGNENLVLNIENDFLNINTNQAEQMYNKKNADVKAVLELLQNKLKDPSQDSIHAPAEIASLWKMNLNMEQDKVVLLYSDTPEGVFCYKVIELFLSSNRWTCLDLATSFHNEFKSNKLAGIQPFSVEDFLNNGLSNLQSIIQMLRDSYGQNHHLLINVTAGYKGVIPWATIFAWNNYADLVYLYEEGDEIIPLNRPNGWIPISYVIEEDGNIKLNMGDVSAP